MVSRNEQHLGVITYESLPHMLKFGLQSLKKERQKRLAMGTVAAVTTGIATVAGKPATFSLAIGATSLTLDYNKKIRRSTANVGARTAMAGNPERMWEAEPRIKAFMESGATHVFVDRKLNLHFIRAPKYAGKAHLPFLGRMRAPLLSLEDQERYLSKA